MGTGTVHSTRKGGNNDSVANQVVLDLRVESKWKKWTETYSLREWSVSGKK